MMNSLLKSTLRMNWTHSKSLWIVETLAVITTVNSRSASRLPTCPIANLSGSRLPEVIADTILTTGTSAERRCKSLELHARIFC